MTRSGVPPLLVGAVRHLPPCLLLATTLALMGPFHPLHAEVAANAPAPAPPPERGQNSPASVRPPLTAADQEYPAAQIEAGRTVFAAQCAFCHGRDTAGGESGPDLTRSLLVASDDRGDKIAPHLIAGRLEKGMPAFVLPAADVAAIVAFVHDQKTKADHSVGGRRSVEPADLQTGDKVAGQRYFEAACTRCHSASGDLAGLAKRLEGLPLLRRMLYPTPAADAEPAHGPQTVRVELPAGKVITGKLAYRDEFTIALVDADGWPHSWPTDRVTFTVDDPLAAHVAQLEKYTDQDMHDVLAYLQTLR